MLNLRFRIVRNKLWSHHHWFQESIHRRKFFRCGPWPSLGQPSCYWWYDHQQQQPCRLNQQLGRQWRQIHVNDLLLGLSLRWCSQFLHTDQNGLGVPLLKKSLNKQIVFKFVFQFIITFCGFPAQTADKEFSVNLHTFCLQFENAEKEKEEKKRRMLVVVQTSIDNYC